jgi:hypothetical protein
MKRWVIGCLLVLVLLLLVIKVKLGPKTGTSPPLPDAATGTNVAIRFVRFFEDILHPSRQRQALGRRGAHRARGRKQLVVALQPAHHSTFGYPREDE